MTSAPTQRPYQTAATAAVLACLATGQNRLLVKKPTGTGKTVWFAELPTILSPWRSKLPKKAGAKMLVIAHREELLDQAADKIIRQNPHLRVSIEQGDRYANGLSDVVIASIQTLSAMKFRRLKRLIEKHGFFPITVVDEAHHAAADSYRTALALLGFLPPAEASDDENIEAAKFEDVAKMEEALHGWDVIAPKDRVLIGVTATPNRSDAIGLGCVFQTIAYSYALKQAIDDGYLVPIMPWVIETDASLDEVRTTAGEFNQKDLAEAVNNEARNKLAVAAWHEHAAGLSTIAFTVDVAHAHALAAEFVDAGVKAIALSGKTPKDERRQILAAYTAGEIELITNCMVLTEGTDLPRTACILHAKPTKSATLYEQMTGRGLRVLPADPVGAARKAYSGVLIKPDCVVIDLVDVARRHSLQTAPVLYGLPPGLMAQGKMLDELKAEIDELLAKYPGMDVDKLGHVTLEQLRARASTFDIWTIIEMGAYGVGLVMKWIRTGTDTFRISYPWQDGNETLTVEPNLLGKYDLVATFRERHQPGVAGPTLVRQRTLISGSPNAQAVLAKAEQYVTSERSTVMRLKDRDAPWRSRPMSPAQIGVLRRMRVPFNEGMTMGAASDMIDMAKARKGR